MADDRETLLYDTGHIHPVVRVFCAALGLIAGVLFLNVAADSILGVSLLNGPCPYPHGKPVALLGAFVLTWFCISCVIGRNRILVDQTANHIILRGPGLALRQRDVCYDGFRIAAVRVRHVHAGIGISGWDIELALADGRHRWLTRWDESDEAGARDLARRIGEAMKKPVE